MLIVLYIILFAICAFFKVLERRKRYEEYWKYIMALPGPKSYPIIGNIDVILKNAESIFEDNHKRAEKYFPIFKIWTFNLSIVFVLHPSDIELVMTNVKHTRKGYFYKWLDLWLKKGLLTSSGPKWHSRRKILTPAFHFSILQKFVEVFNKETEHLVQVLKSLSDRPSVNIVEPITEFTLNAIGETSLGINMRDAWNLSAYKSAIYKFGYFYTYRMVRPWLRLDFIYQLTTLSKEVEKTIRTLHDFSTEIIEKRKVGFNSKGDASYSGRKRMAMLDLLLKAKYEDGVDIDDEGIREEVDTFMFEGHDTTSSALCHILLVLANEPDAQAKIYEELRDILGDKTLPDFQDLHEMKFMERCIKECLRLFPSVPFITRVLGDRIETSTGHVLPKGTAVAIPIYCVHRLEENWENPSKFDPNRFLPENMAKRHPFAYLPFSAGPRNCIGQKFAFVEMKSALCGILRNFKLEPIDDYRNIKHKADLVLRPKSDIKVKLIPR